MKPKFQKKFEAMRQAGQISALALQKVLEKAAPGVTLQELDELAEEIILSKGAEPGFKRMPGYNYTTCTNVNEGLVHGLPTDYALKEGDLLSVDLGAYYKGYNSDQCWTVEIGTNKHADFLEVGEKTLELAISKAIPGNRVGDISAAIQDSIESAGYTVSRSLVGHGVGKKLHEPPQIPGFKGPNKGKKLKEGMTLAIEVIYQKGDYPIKEADDGWTIETADKSLAAVFEHSIGVTNTKPLVFTDF
ncbi:type I methionyl aminopeptidase [candidate division WWE3 bacterium]|nr:type I methionyl aminopeptidase [candidate division WWE3 bacterium]